MFDSNLGKYEWECAQCNTHVVTNHGTWDETPEGWGCLYGSICICSQKCAEEFAKDSVYGVLRPGDFDTSVRNITVLY